MKEIADNAEITAIIEPVIGLVNAAVDTSNVVPPTNAVRATV
jgi:hypothetical protein